MKSAELDSPPISSCALHTLGDKFWECQSTPQPHRERLLETPLESWFFLDFSYQDYPAVHLAYQRCIKRIPVRCEERPPTPAMFACQLLLSIVLGRNAPSQVHDSRSI
jgi:hypothetical protein